MIQYSSLLSWNRIIQSSSSIMAKFHLCLLNRENHCWHQKLEEILGLERCFQSICVTLKNSDKAKKLQKISVKHGNQVKALTVVDSKLENLDEFRDILKSFQQLMHLELRFVEILDENLENFDGNQVTTELESIELDDCSWKIAMTLKCPNLKSLKIRGPQESQLESQHSIEFLKTLSHLKTFKVSREFFEIVFSSRESRKLNFKLNKLKFYTNFSDNSPDVDENFVAFLNLQRRSLKFLSLEVASGEVLRTIFMKLKLKVLKIGFHCLPSDGKFYEKLPEMRSVHQINCYTGFASEQTAISFLRKFPNLRELYAELDCQVLSNILPSISPQLSRLAISTISSHFQFESLEYLHLQSIENVENFVEFLRINTTIETLSVNWTTKECFLDECFQDFLSKTTIKHLILNSDAATVEFIQKSIRKMNNQNLKVVELKFYCPDLKSTVNKVLKFPQF
jgi:hypothetical protein